MVDEIVIKNKLLVDDCFIDIQLSNEKKLRICFLIFVDNKIGIIVQPHNVFHQFAVDSSKAILFHFPLTTSMCP